MTEPDVICIADSTSVSSSSDSFTAPMPIIHSPPSIVKQGRLSLNAVLGIHGSFSDSDDSSMHLQQAVDILHSRAASDHVFSYASSSSFCSSSSLRSSISSTDAPSQTFVSQPPSSSQLDLKLNQALLNFIDSKCHSSHAPWTAHIFFSQISKQRIHPLIKITQFVGLPQFSIKNSLHSDLQYFCSTKYPTSQTKLSNEVPLKPCAVGYLLNKNIVNRNGRIA